MQGPAELYKILKKLNIGFEYYEYTAVFTMAEAIQHLKNILAAKCKNLFFRNHKGSSHYLVILEYTRQLEIKDLEQRLQQGKLSFASEKRLDKYLGLSTGSVSPFGLINDKEKHVKVFIDRNLKSFEKISFHPNINTATLVISFADFLRFLEWTGNAYEFIKLYD